MSGIEESVQTAQENISTASAAAVQQINDLIENIQTYLTNAETSATNANEVLETMQEMLAAGTPVIGTNGNWWIGETDTGKPARGIKGDKGDTGNTGATGATGAKGDKGDTGEQGPAGEVPTLHAVATSGDYDDLENKPAIPTGFSAALPVYSSLSAVALQNNTTQSGTINLATYLPNDGKAYEISIFTQIFNNSSYSKIDVNRPSGALVSSAQTNCGGSGYLTWGYVGTDRSLNWTHSGGNTSGDHFISIQAYRCVE